MNKDGIEHVSYTIMDLRLSPSTKYLLAATDTNRLFIFAVRCSKWASRWAAVGLFESLNTLFIPRSRPTRSCATSTATRPARTANPERCGTRPRST